MALTQERTHGLHRWEKAIIAFFGAVIVVGLLLVAQWLKVGGGPQDLQSFGGRLLQLTGAVTQVGSLGWLRGRIKR